MSTVQISDFFGFYPEIDYWVPTDLSTFDRQLSRKQEFQELKPGLTEAIPKRGEGFLTQKTAVRYMTWYDRLLLMHDPGTGKSCIITHSAELFKNEYLKNPNDPTKINRAIILVNGPTLIENIKNEIVCRCTDRIYETEFVTRSENERTMKGNITRLLSEWYDIMTYHTFASTIRKLSSDEEIDKYMSRKVVYIDEGHNVPTLLNIRDPTANLDSDYSIIHKALHMGSNNKVFIATATPMVNTPNDIVTPINLILPLDFQMAHAPFDTIEEEERFANQPFDYFEPYFRGRVSYVRALQTGARNVPQGQLMEGTSTIITPCFMSAFQYTAYLSNVLSGSEKESFYLKQRQASNFVFPDGSFGSEGFSRYVVQNRQKYQFRDNDDGRQLRELVQIPEYLGLFSAKFAEIISICQDSFPETEVVTDDAKGILFIFFPSFEKGSGAVLLGLCLEANGYEEFTETHSVFIDTTSGARAVPCPPSKRRGVERRPRGGFTKKKRFAILSSSTPEARVPAIFSTLNSYENRYGQYLQILIGTQTAKEGISVYNAVGMIMSSSGWNPSINFQAMERVFRSVSHDDRISEKRERLAAEGLPTDDVSIEVRTWNMASVYDYSPEELEADLELVPDLRVRMEESLELTELLLQSNFNMIDVQMFIRAEQKNILMKRVLRKMKRAAFDRYINYGRNIRATDVDGSADCDYDVCDYVDPEDLAGLPIDWTTKIMYYSGEEIEYVQLSLREIFSKYHSLKTDRVVNMIQQQNDKIERVFVEMAIEKTIREDSSFVDSKGREWRFIDRMGFRGFLRESSDGVLYIERDQFEIRSQPENTAYSSVIIGTQNIHNNSFLDYVTEMKTLSELPVIESLMSVEPGSPEFFTMLNGISVANQVMLLETAVLERVTTGLSTAFYENIISAFNHALFQIDEPIDLLNQTRRQLNNRGKTRGRKPNPNTQPKTKRLEFGTTLSIPKYDPNLVGEKIYLQNLTNQESNSMSSYSMITRYFNAEGKIRLLKVSEEQGWRDVTEGEYIVYRELIREQIRAMDSYFDAFEIYGISLPPENVLHLRDRSKEGPEASRDARFVYSGKKCTFWNKNELIDIVVRMGVKIRPHDRSSLTIEQMRNFLRRESGVDYTDEDDMMTAYALHSYNRDAICQVIEENLRDTGRINTGKRPSRPGVMPAGGSIRVPGPMTEPDYSQPFSPPSSSLVPSIPTESLPQFAASVGQAGPNYTPVSSVPDFTGPEEPRSTAEISTPPPNYG